MVWRETELAYEDGGVQVVVSHVPAFVCLHEDDRAFTPEIAEDLYRTIRELVAVAKRARESHVTHVEYLVKA